MTPTLNSTKWKEVYESDSVQEYDRFIEMATMGHARALDALVQLIDRPRQMPIRVLELGVGTGLLTHRILLQFPRSSVFGVDGSNHMLKLASFKLNEFGSRFKSIQSTFEGYSWDRHLENEFDFVVSSFSIHHMDHDRYGGFFREIHRVLKPEGELLIADYTKSRFPRIQERYEDAWAQARMAQTNRALGMNLSKNEVRRENEARHAAEGDNPATLDDLLLWLGRAGFREPECFWKHFCYSIYGGLK